MAGPFALIDCARDEKLPTLVKLAGASACLFAGRLPPETEAVAPYIVDLSTAPALNRAWSANGRGRHWGLVVHSAASLEDLRRHFRHFLGATLPDGTPVMFRFYDPRVLLPFLKASGVEDLQRWFAAVDSFVFEDGDALLAVGFDGAGLTFAPQPVQHRAQPESG